MNNSFIAQVQNQSDPYFRNFSDFMKSVDNGKSIMENWDLIEKAKDENSDKIISHLIDLACNTQNIANINIGRYFLQKTSKDWLMKRLERLVKSFLENGVRWSTLAGHFKKLLFHKIFFILYIFFGQAYASPNSLDH